MLFRSHTLVPWGHFAGHGHSRAQELSLLIWSAGTDWSTNTGNWPGNDPAGVELAHGWDGGNGPHVAGESALAPRRSTLRAQAQGPGLRFLDLERMVGPAVAGSLRVRRQILQWQGSTWIVLDTYSDAASRELRVIWTAAPETAQRPLGPRQFGFEREGSQVALRLAIDGSAGVTASPLRGSRDPFGGWVAFDRKAAPAPAVDARLPSPEGWMLATLALRPATESERPQAPWQASMLRYVGPQEWSIRLGAEGAGVELSRQADSLLIRSSAPGGHESAGEIRRLALVAGEPVDVALAAIEKSRAELLAVYPRFRTLETVRWRYSVALAGLWFGLSVLIVVATYVCARGRVLKEFVGARSRLGRS